VQTNDKSLKDVVADMANDIDGGMKLSSAFAKHPEVFSDFYVAMLRSGETSGRLERVLNYLATQMEKDYDLISRIRGAMVYPAFILIAMVGVGATMLIFVVPKMTSLLEETGGELPFMTRLLIGLSNFLVGYWWFVLLMLFIGLAVFRIVLRSTYGRERWDYFKLKIPVFGSLFKKIILSRFATGLSTLIKGGVPISRALQITSDVVSNQSFKKILEDTVREVEDGNSITTVFAQHKLVPTMVPQMMSVGERTGRMDEVLDRLGEFYSREVDTMIGSLTSLIEPMIMIVLGVAVGLMVSAIILPIFQVANSIS
jgi:type IV pilus assembly protein PilC